MWSLSPSLCVEKDISAKKEREANRGNGPVKKSRHLTQEVVWSNLWTRLLVAIRMK